MDEYIGIVKLFSGNFAPKGWAFCNGQLLSIASNQALFSIIGTTYGGDGVTNFALPNLSGRVPLGTGQGTIGNTYVNGQVGGQENITLSISEIPAHAHSVLVNPAAGNSNVGTNNFLASGQVQVDRSSPVLPTNSFSSDPAGGSSLNPSAVTPVGGNMPHSNLQPFLAMNYIICLYGIYPPRD